MAGSKATSPRLEPSALTCTTLSARGAEVPPSVVTLTLPMPCTGSAVRLSCARRFCSTLS